MNFIPYKINEVEVDFLYLNLWSNNRIIINISFQPTGDGGSKIEDVETSEGPLGKVKFSLLSTINMILLG